MKKALWRSQFGVECREIYGDLCGAEKVLLADGGGGDGSEEGKDGDCAAGDYGKSFVSLIRFLFVAVVYYYFAALRVPQKLFAVR